MMALNRSHRLRPVTTVIALAQGLWVRRQIEILPAAKGPTRGATSGLDEPLMRALVVGESTAAGCGVETHESSFAGAFAKTLSKSAGRPIAWTVVGEPGATARRIRYRLLPDVTEEHDVAIVLAGANDVLHRRTPADWKSDLEAIVDELSQRAGLVVVVAAPPFALFPSLPTTLARYLADRASQLDEASALLCSTRPRALFAPAPTEVVDDSFFARDGFHPGRVGYERWADAIADRVTKHLGLSAT